MKYTKDEIRKAMLLYAVTDRSWLQEGQKLADVVKCVLENGATFLQLREKELPQDEILEEAKRLKILCNEYRVPFVVNDSVEIALACDTDGVHVGQSDIRDRDIRAIIGEDRILGMTARTVEQAVAAEKAGADYIGVGAVFGTTTKRDARAMTLDRLEEICAAVAIPVVAIGGIGLHNIDQLAGKGMAGAAVVSGIFAAEDPGAATAELLKKAQKAVGVTAV